MYISMAQKTLPAFSYDVKILFYPYVEVTMFEIMLLRMCHVGNFLLNYLDPV